MIDPLSAKAVEKLGDRAFDSIGYLGKLLLEPALTEAGGALGDTVAAWRLVRANALAEWVRKKLGGKRLPAGQFVNPKVLAAILERSSLEADDQVQEMWAGLLLSSASTGGEDDDNLIFTDLLARIPRAAAHVLDQFYSSVHVIDGPEEPTFDVSHRLKNVEQLDAFIEQVTGFHEKAHRDRIFGHLRRLELISLGMPAPQVTMLGLELYARVNGHSGDPVEFYRTLSGRPSPT